MNANDIRIRKRSITLIDLPTAKFGTTVSCFEKNGGDDGTRTRGLCRDSTPFARN